MKYIKIIGLPSIVSARYRIVIDKSIRKLYGIRGTSEVYMQRNKNLLIIKPTTRKKSSMELKELSIGRFNLPIDWAKSNHVQIGGCVYLVATTEGIIVCPKGTEFLCIEGMISK
nr:AbrB/MazE/SpoVT family DNA-binding domain-containing protein [uncultured Caproiciproducens sp.]